MIILAIVLVTLVAFYMYNVRNFDYWKKRGVVYKQPVVIFGSHTDMYLQRKSLTQFATELYFKYPEEKVIGTFKSTMPGLIIRDPEIIKHVLLSDFYNFHKRGLLPGRTLEPLLRNLFFAEGDLWRLLRQRMTPAFTTGKLKAMFPLIIERAEKLQQRTSKVAEEGRSIDARDLMARFTTDFIGACAFGLDTRSLDEEDSAFRKLGVNIFQSGIKEAISIILKTVFPNWTDFIRYAAKVENEVNALVKNILEQRNYEPTDRNDFIDQLLECRKKGAMIGQSMVHFNKDGTPKEAKVELDDSILAAQVMVFFAAGFETSSSATSFTLHQLAYHQEVQIKVQKEIDYVLSKYNNKLSYDAIKEMSYLEWTFKEAMRLFPSLGYLARKCVSKYTFPGFNWTIDEGVSVLIPIQALHLDPKYWKNPREFRPERFHPDEFNGITKSIYLPFGDGPRSCIGERLGLMQSLAGLAAILARFSVEPAPESKRYPEIETKPDIVQIIKGGLPLMFRERKTNI